MSYERSFTVWNIIETYLKKRDMNIYQLTKKAGLSTGYLYNYKRGYATDMPLSTAIKVADVLDFSLDEFREEQSHDKRKS